MIPLGEAQDYVLERASRLPEETVDITSAREQVTAEAVISGELVPPFDNTAVDGYAVKAADTDGASESNDLRALGSMDDAGYFYTQADYGYWANNYPEDTT